MSKYIQEYQYSRTTVAKFAKINRKRKFPVLQYIYYEPIINN